MLDEKELEGLSIFRQWLDLVNPSDTYLDRMRLMIEAFQAKRV